MFAILNYGGPPVYRYIQSVEDALPKAIAGLIGISIGASLVILSASLWSGLCELKNTPFSREISPLEAVKLPAKLICCAGGIASIIMAIYKINRNPPEQNEIPTEPLMFMPYNYQL